MARPFSLEYAASSKLIDIGEFKLQLGKSPVISLYAVYIAWIVPIAEIMIAGLLVFSKFRVFGFYAFITVMSMFTAYIIVILNYGEFIPCSCGGLLQNMNWSQHLWFNIGFILLAICGALLSPGSNKINNH